MNIQLIIAFFIILQIRKSFQTAKEFPWWDKILLPALYTCIGLQVIAFSVRWAVPVISFLSFIVVLGVIGIIYIEEKFESFKPTVIAVLPLILVSLISNGMRLIDKEFYNNWDFIFSISNAFAFIRM